MSPSSVHVNDLEALVVVKLSGVGGDGGDLLLLLPGHVGVPVHKVVVQARWSDCPGHQPQLLLAVFILEPVQDHPASPSHPAPAVAQTPQAPAEPEAGEDEGPV